MAADVHAGLVSSEQVTQQGKDITEKPITDKTANKIPEEGGMIPVPLSPESSDGEAGVYDEEPSVAKVQTSSKPVRATDWIEQSDNSRTVHNMITVIKN